MKKSEIIKLAIKNNFDESYLSGIKAPLLKRAFAVEFKKSTDITIVLKTVIDNLNKDAAIYNIVPKEKKKKKSFTKIEGEAFIQDLENRKLIINN